MVFCTERSRVEAGRFFEKVVTVLGPPGLRLAACSVASFGEYFASTYSSPDNVL
jgi:hypothetical protein